MLPNFLIQALFGFGAGCFIIGITIFHYFRDKVEKGELEKLSILFSSSATDSLIADLKSGELPFAVTKDFMNQFNIVGKSRRRLRSLLLFFPITGGLFMGSAVLASLATIESEIIKPIADVFEFSADSLLLIAFLIVIYCIYQLVKLARELT